jgi:uncharacterized protein (DUF427 family)
MAGADFPAALMPPDRVEPVPRRVRGFAGGVAVVDTTRALYGWEWPYYPQFYFPLDDVCTDLLVAEGRYEGGPFGRFEWYGLQAGDEVRTAAAKVLGRPSMAPLAGTVSFVWGALDAWFEEDERVFVHPRNPYSRVDALRSTRRVRVDLEGVALAETASPVLVFETGLPTRYYINRTEVDFSHLLPSDTVTACPYKGTTGDYWSVRVGEHIHADLAWSYRFPSGALLPIAGLVAFYNEKVDITLDGRPLDRPRTHFS